MANATHAQIAEDIRAQVADQIGTIRSIAAQTDEAATRTTGQESFMARHAVAAHYFLIYKRYADLLKDNGLKAGDNADAICADLGISYKTISNFRAVSDLHHTQAEKSYSALGFQGSIDATKKFAHLNPESVNAICVRVAQDEDLKPVQSAGRHLLKHANSYLKEDPELNPSEVVAQAYLEILVDPEAIADMYKTEAKDYKTLWEAAQRLVDAQKAEIAVLRAQIAEAAQDAEAITEAAQVAA